ncbi:MAG TPA: hypothetical protein VHD63_10015 [Ktedonobacteraceae bacterium]|nr:hypothetical protein [Ktedonobacteraceae bacterium]
MSNENEQFAGSWDDEDELSSSAREADWQSDRRRPPRSSKLPQNTPEMRGRRQRPRGVPGSADYYEEIESDEPPSRPRPVRQSREEVEARLRQRARQPIYSREAEEPRSRSVPPARKQAPRGAEESRYPSQSSGQARATRDFSSPRSTRDFSASRQTRDFAQEAPRPTRDFSASRRGEFDDGYDDSGEIDIIIERPPSHRHHRPRRGRRVFSTLLTGCLGGLITLIVVAGVLIFLVLHNTPLGQTLGNVGKSPFKQSAQQPLTLGSATQVIIRNQAGNIAVKVDSSATVATLGSTKLVQASNQDEANTQFTRMALSVTPLVQKADPACLADSCVLVNATVPSTPGGGGLLGSSTGPSIDLTLTLPASFNSPDPTTPTIITASTSAGAINVSGFNGVINLNSTSGNITVAHTLIYAGTCVQTLHGTITIAQQSIFDLATPAPRVPCSNAASNDPHRPWFSVKSGVGNVDITLTTNLSNLLLDANTNDGQINDDFHLKITSSDGSDTYHGPLVPNTNPGASLYVATSTGDITLRKA